MEELNKKKERKQNILIVLGLFVLIGMIGGLTFAFFNYTRTGQTNTLRVGEVEFNSTQENIALLNVFPVDKNNLDSSNSDTAIINITGNTTYSDGLEYKVTIEAVNNTINGKEVPISLNISANNLGTKSSDYYNERGLENNVYDLREEGEAYNGKYVIVGYIKPDENGVNGSVNITAFIDKNKVAISDTYDGTEAGLMGTEDDWVMGREVFTTSEWNTLSVTPLTFKIKVESNEGIWVEQEKFITLKKLSSIQSWKNIRASVTSIEFHKDGVVPENYETSFDVTDDTSNPDKGRIMLYTVDDGLGNGTCKAIVVANDTIYAPKGSSTMFGAMSKLIIFNSKNFKVDNVTSMSGMFLNCRNLTNINTLSTWNTSNVTNMSTVFSGCTNLFDTSAINDWDINPNANFSEMFYNAPSHPEFTKVSGTWDANGTFIPTV